MAITLRRPDALDELRAEVDALRARVAALEAQANVRSGDDALAAELLPVLAIVLGDSPFLTDYVAETRDAALRFVIGRRSTKSLGKFFCRIDGRAFDGLALVADGRVRGRRQWRLRRTVSS